MASKAAELLAGALEKSADAHEAGTFGNEFERIEAVRREVSNMNDIPRPTYKLAMRFWKAWATAAGQDWRDESRVCKDDWPVMAHTIAQHVRSGSLPPDKKILNNFFRKPRSLSWRYISLLKGSSRGASK